MKSMLWKVVQKFDKQWDKALPYLMFTYREVPQESTGFSPFELLYGQQVRGVTTMMHWRHLPPHFFSEFLSASE